MEYRNPTQHRMTRRAAAHDYTASGVYHITLHVADDLGQPLGVVVGDLSCPDGSAGAPRVDLSPVGKMVEHELLHSITDHYPMITVDSYVIMPDHLHCLLVVQDRIVSQRGKVQPIGQVIAGFKFGCNRAYWELLEQRAQPAATLTTANTQPASPSPSSPASPSPATSIPAVPSIAPSQAASSLASPSSPAASPAPAASSAVSVPCGLAAGGHPLFSAGYCDVMPVDAAQLATQRRYIADNPRSRLLRSGKRSLHTQRGGIATALSPAALRGYLERECPPHLVAPDLLAPLFGQLLMAPDGTITCDTFGDRRLLSRPLLPVVCHRKDASRFAKQQARCLDEAAHGAVLVSARIAKGEQAIMDEAVNRGFPVALIADNGFGDRYHPSADRLSLCDAGHLLLITPWQYHYRPKEEDITVAACKTMNCIAQALCRTKDTWWKQH